MNYTHIGITHSAWLWLTIYVIIGNIFMLFIVIKGKALEDGPVDNLTFFIAWLFGVLSWPWGLWYFTIGGKWNSTKNN